MRMGAFQKKHVNEVLIRNPGFRGKTFEIINGFILNANSDLLF